MDDESLKKISTKKGILIFKKVTAQLFRLKFLKGKTHNCCIFCFKRIFPRSCLNQPSPFINYGFYREHLLVKNTIDNEVFLKKCDVTLPVICYANVNIFQ